MTSKIKEIAGIHHFEANNDNYINLWGEDNKKQFLFAITSTEFLEILQNNLSAAAIRDAIDAEYNDDIGLIGLVELARAEFREYIELTYNFPKNATTNLSVADIIFEYVLLYIKEKHNIDISQKRSFNNLHKSSHGHNAWSWISFTFLCQSQS